MFCNKCGSEIVEGFKFCSKCGTPVAQVSKPSNEEIKKVVEEEIQEEKVEVKNEPIKETQTINAQPKAPKKPLTKTQKIFVFVAAVALVVVGYFGYNAIFGPKPLDLTDCSSLESEGIDGYGHAYFSDNKASESYAIISSAEAMEDEYNALCRLTPNSKDCKKLHEKFYYLQAALNTVHTDIEYSKGKDNGYLSNGDVVTLTIEYNEELFKKAGYKITSNVKEFIVEGLEVPEAIDLFKGVSVAWEESWSDFYPALYVDNEYNIDGVYYLNETDNGITVEVDEEYLIRNYHYKASDDIYTKTFDIGSKPEFVTYIDGSNYDKVAELAKKVMNEYYCDKCGCNLYNGDNIELIGEKELYDLYVSYSNTVVANFLVHTEGGQYNKKIEFKAMKDTSGNYVLASKIDKEHLGCTIRRGEWYEN